MKRALALGAALALLLIPGLAASGTAGGAEDPLITRSYLTDTFYSQVRLALAGTAERQLAAAAPRERSPRLAALALRAGEYAAFSAGQQFLFLDGETALTLRAGTVLDVTLGAPAGESAAADHRYVVCEDSALTLYALTDCALLASPGAETGAGTAPVPENPFLDVPEDSWYRDDVVSACQKGLIDGVTPDSFAPAEKLTAVQCVKLAACMHQLCRTGSVTLEAGEDGPWYQSYLDYALEQGITDRTWGDDPICRADFVGMFYRAVPEEDLAAVNTVADWAIPDVYPELTEGWAEIYALYRAGVLTGYSADGVHAEHAFAPADTISRAEVAAIMNRMLDGSARLRFDLEG